MCSSPNTEVKLKFRRIVYFLRKVYILVKRENITFKRKALLTKFRYHKWDCLKKKTSFPFSLLKRRNEPTGVY